IEGHAKLTSFITHFLTVDFLESESAFIKGRIILEGVGYIGRTVFCFGVAQEKFFWQGNASKRKNRLVKWDILFWEDTLLDGSSLKYQYPAMYNIVRHKSITIAEAMTVYLEGVTTRGLR
ncbi:hypothetical protein ACJX0J_022633, partial [Zea mays]